MVAYGFRLHKVTAHEGLTRAELGLGLLGPDGAALDAITVLRDRIDGLAGTTLVGRPLYAHSPADLLPQPPSALPRLQTRPYMHIARTSRSGQKLKVVLQYGREGDFDSLLDQTGTPQPMRGRAASRTYRVWFLVPPGGTVIYMISETKGQSFAGEALLDRVRVENQRAASTPRGTDLDVGRWIRWRHEPLFDGTRINDIFRDAENFELELRRVGHTRQGAASSSILKVTEQGLQTGPRIQGAVQAVRSWWDNRDNGTAAARSERAARDLGTLIDLNVNFANLGFNDGEIRFMQDGKVQRIDPNKIEKLFVYPVGQAPLDDDEMTARAADRLDNINRDLSLNIDLSDLR